MVSMAVLVCSMDTCRLTISFLKCHMVTCKNPSSSILVSGQIILAETFAGTLRGIQIETARWGERGVNLTSLDSPLMHVYV